MKLHYVYLKTDFLKTSVSSFASESVNCSVPVPYKTIMCVREKLSFKHESCITESFQLHSYAYCFTTFLKKIVFLTLNMPKNPSTLIIKHDDFLHHDLEKILNVFQLLNIT